MGVIGSFPCECVYCTPPQGRRKLLLKQFYNKMQGFKVNLNASHPPFDISEFNFSRAQITSP